MKVKLFVFIAFILSFSFTFAVNFTSKIDSKWTNGYCYKFFVENNESKSINDWNIQFNIWTSTIKSKRNGKFVCTNENCKVTGVSWNKKIKVWQKFEIGFCTDWNILPSNIKFVGSSQNLTNQSITQISQNSSNTSQSQKNNFSNDKNNQTLSTNSTKSTNPEIIKNYTIKKAWFVVEIKKQSDWRNGYCRQIILKNTNTNRKITYWKLQFNLNQSSTNSWNAKFYKNSKWIYTVFPEDYNKQIQANSNTTIWFCSNGKLRDKNWKILKVKFTTVSVASALNNAPDNNSIHQNKVGSDNSTNTQQTFSESSQQTNTSTSSNFETIIKPEGQLVWQYTKNKWATYKASDKILEINPWNISSADGDAKMYYDNSNGVTTYIQNFSNIKQQNAGGYVLGYPEVYIWNKPWNGNYVDGWSKLPAKLNELKSLNVEASRKYEHPSNLSCDFAMEGWFTKNKFQKTGVGNGEVEMMVMWYRNIQGAAWNKVWTTTIPVELNWKLQNITFDIYKANIGWDFVTFIPQNYKDFKNASIKFDILDFAKQAEKYVPQIKDLYLEDWEFGTEYGTPSTKTAKLAWQITKFKVTGEKVENNENDNKASQTQDITPNNKIKEQTQSGNQINTSTSLPPYNFDKFKHVLFNSEFTYPTSKNIIIDKWQFENYKSNFFYATKDGVMYFILPKKVGETHKVRVELREQQNHKSSGWSKDTSEIHYLKAIVKLQAIQNSNIPEYTFLQIQETEYYKPLLRMVVRYKKDGKINHIWAVIRNTTGYDGKISDRIDLWPIMQDIFDNYKVLIGNNKLDIYRNWTLMVDRNISYWTPKHNYFKAGIYDSWNGKGSFKIKIGFNQLDWGVLTKNITQSQNSVYQVKTPNIQETKAKDYYQTSSNKLNNYNELIPESYKNQVDNVFLKLTQLYKWDDLKQKLNIVSTKIDNLINKYSSDSKVLAILLYIKNKADLLLKNLDNSSNLDNSIDYFVKWTEIYKKVWNKIQNIHLFWVNWFGFETPNYTVHGLWSRNYKNMLKQIKSLWFNAIRLPFCSKIIQNPKPTSIDYYKNQDLKWLWALDIMKKIIWEANKQGIYVLLDYHRIGCNYIEPMRKTKSFTEQDYINVWKKMAQIFSKYPNVIWADLKNEPHSEGQGDSLYQNGSTWWYNSQTDWNLAAERIWKAVLSVAPNWLIFVEWTQVTNPQTDKSYKWWMNAWWGGNLMAVKKYPVHLPSNKLVYSPHVYGPDVYNQPYFNELNFPNNMPDIWYHHFGYVKSELKHPVIFGEFGWKYGAGNPKDKIWQQKLVDRMIKNNYCSFFYWSWNPDSGDTAGILKDNWMTINQGKYDNLKRLMNYCSNR